MCLNISAKQSLTVSTRTLCNFLGFLPNNPGIIAGTRPLLPSFPGESLCQQGQEGDRIVRGQEAEISRDIYNQGDTHCSVGHTGKVKAP